MILRQEGGARRCGVAGTGRYPEAVQSCRCGIYVVQYESDMAATTLPPEIVARTIALAAAFAKSQAVVSARAHIGLFYQDAAATELFRKVSEYGGQLREKREAGMPPGEKELAEFDRLRQDVINNPRCKGFLEAREQLDLMLATVNQFLCMAIDKGCAPTEEEVAQSMTQQLSSCSCGGHCKGECDGSCGPCDEAGRHSCHADA